MIPSAQPPGIDALSCFAWKIVEQHQWTAHFKARPPISAHGVGSGQRTPESHRLRIFSSHLRISASPRTLKNDPPRPPRAPHLSSSTAQDAPTRLRGVFGVDSRIVEFRLAGGIIGVPSWNRGGGVAKIPAAGAVRRRPCPLPVSVSVVVVAVAVLAPLPSSCHASSVSRRRLSCVCNHPSPRDTLNRAPGTQHIDIEPDRQRIDQATTGDDAGTPGPTPAADPPGDPFNRYFYTE